MSCLTGPWWYIVKPKSQYHLKENWIIRGGRKAPGVYIEDARGKSWINHWVFRVLTWRKKPLISPAVWAHDALQPSARRQELEEAMGGAEGFRPRRWRLRCGTVKLSRIEGKGATLSFPVVRAVRWRATCLWVSSRFPYQTRMRPVSVVPVVPLKNPVP